jgi:hypothetical protein
MTIMGIIYLFAIMTAVLLYFYHKNFTDLIFPPHEFVYGAALKSIDDLPAQVDKFLSLDGMDPAKITIQTYSGNSSSYCLGLLTKAIASKKNKKLIPLIESLKEINDLENKKEQAIKLVETLIPYRDHLRNKAKQDDLIVFIHFSLKRPAELSFSKKMLIESHVAALDTPAEEKRFKKRRCSKKYLAGNINIYPFFLENTSWHEMVDMGSLPDAPILEIRFMGLKGVFKYLLSEMSKRSGCQFNQMDGGFIE